MWKWGTKSGSSDPVESPATNPPFRPMDRTGNVADLISQQHPPPSLLLALLTQLCLSPSFYSAHTLYGGHTDTRGSLLKPAPGARKLLGIQGFAAAEAGQNFSAQDGLPMGMENYIPYISAYIDAVCKNLSEPRSSQLTLFMSCIYLDSA